MIIDRSKWFHGMTDGASLLSDSKTFNKMCCLGFLGCEVGITKSDLEGKPIPSSCSINLFKWPVILFTTCNYTPKGFNYCNWEYTFAHVNDAKDIDDSIREDWIKTGFKIILGIDVEFVGEY